VVAWAQGGISYDRAKEYPLQELWSLQRQFAKINREMQSKLTKE